MFSSITDPNLFPNLPPSYAFLGGDGTDFFLHHSDLLMADTLFGMVVSNKSPVRNPEACSEPNYEQNFGPKSMLTKPKKAVAKKQHKHSKIFTAQGLRDRRVRLSIETARKFFDLQDMLGFEKASKTIDWLLKNSKAEIKEVMKKSSLITSAAPGCGVLVSGNHDEGSKMMKKLIKSSTVGKGKEVKLQKDRDGFDDRYLASREARARARERARERTRGKKMVRSDQLKGFPISSDEQKISEDNFKSSLYKLWKGPATSRANGNIV